MEKRVLLVVVVLLFLKLPAQNGHLLHLSSYEEVGRIKKGESKSKAERKRGMLQALLQAGALSPVYRQDYNSLGRLWESDGMGV